MPMPPMPPGVIPPKPMLPGPGNTAPASVPTQNLGSRAKGFAIVGLAVKALETALPLLSASSDEGQAVLDAMKKLASKGFRQPNPQITKNEMQLIGSNSPAVPPMPQQMAQQKFGQMAPPEAA